MNQLTLATRHLSGTRRRRGGIVFEREGARRAGVAMCELIEPVYPSPNNGRPPVGVERMLRIYFLQQWFGPGTGKGGLRAFTAELKPGLLATFDMPQYPG
jgi:hypothetical protein